MICFQFEIIINVLVISAFSASFEYICFVSATINPFTTMHDGNFRRHSSMNVTIKNTQIFVKYILHLCIFRHLKLEIALAIPASNDEK